jgi:GPH family glycoside/pentoside/hexuronide:cation symporter
MTPAKVNNDRSLGVMSVGLYAGGSFGTGVFSTVPTVLLLYFCTEILKIDPAKAAIIVFVPKAWSIVWDPMVGAFSDAARTPFGRRRPFLAAGLVGVAVSFVLLFSPPVLTADGLFIWTATAYFALATLYSLFAVPYTAAPAEIGSTPTARAQLVGARMFMAMIGVLAGAAAAPALVETFGGGRQGYASMSWWIAGACALFMSLPIFMLGKYDRPGRARGAHEPAKARPNLFVSLQSPRFRPLLLSFLLQLSAVGVISSSAPYLVVKALHHPPGDVGLALFAMLGVTTIATPVWAFIGRKIGEARAIVIAALLYCAAAGFLGWSCTSGADWNQALLAFALAGAPFAGLQVAPYTYAAHLIHEECRNESSAEGAFTGMWTATEKLGLALGPALTGAVLSVGGGAGALPPFVMAAPGVLLLLSLPLLALTARKPTSTP